MCLSVCLLYFYLFHSVCISFLYWSVCQSFVCVHPISVYLACLPTVSVYLSVDSHSVFLSVCVFFLCLLYFWSCCDIYWLLNLKKKYSYPQRRYSSSTFCFSVCMCRSILCLSVSLPLFTVCVWFSLLVCLSNLCPSVCLSVCLSILSLSILSLSILSFSLSCVCLLWVLPTVMSVCLSGTNACFTMTDEHDILINPLFPLIPARISVQTQNWMW